MKKTACLVLSTVVFAFMFSIVALVSPALAEVNQTQQATTLNSQGVSSTAVDDQSQNEQNAHSRSSIQATSVPKTSIANAQVSKQGMMRNVVSGREIKPTVVIKVSGKTLVEGKDYRLKFGSETVFQLRLEPILSLLKRWSRAAILDRSRSETTSCSVPRSRRISSMLLALSPIRILCLMRQGKGQMLGQM